MTARWKVTKRDGVWVAIDREGDLRHAAADWRQVITFALLGAEEPAPEPDPTHAQIAERLARHVWLRQLWLRRFMGEDQ